MSRTLDTARRAAVISGRLLAAVIVVAGLSFLGSRLLGFQDYVITGGSMSGTFEQGALVIEREVPVDRLQVGDVITYLPPADSGTRSLVTHRIVEMTEDPAGQVVLRTKGDANPDTDPWLFTLDARTQPVVALAIPWVGHALLLLADPQVRVLLIGLPAGAIALLAARDLIGALRRRGPRPARGTLGSAQAAP
jgi:signal peptidase